MQIYRFSAHGFQGHRECQAPCTKFNPPFYNCGQARCTDVLLSQQGWLTGWCPPRATLSRACWPVFSHAATAKLWKRSSAGSWV